MISNQAASSANMTGDLFQIFNLPKSGNSSYLFSDIIKVIGSESEGENVNSLTSSFFADGSKSLIDSNKLISLLKSNMKTGTMQGNTGEDLTGKYYITETELTEFINKLGLEGSAEAAKLSSEIAVEVTPAFLNKLSELINNNKFQVHKNIFATIAPEEEQPKEIELSDGEESDEAEGSDKIQVIFKKVEPENDVIAVPQQFVFNTEQNTAIGTGETAEGEFLFGGQSKNIVLGGNKYEFFADTSSGNTQGAQVLSGGATASAGTEQSSSNSGAEGNTFAEVFAEMNASAGAAETAEVPEAVKTFKSDGSFFTQSPGVEIESPEGKTTALNTNANTASTDVNPKADNLNANSAIQGAVDNPEEKITPVASEVISGENDKSLSAENTASKEMNAVNPEITKTVAGVKTEAAKTQNKVTAEDSGKKLSNDSVSASTAAEDNEPAVTGKESSAATGTDAEKGIQGLKTEQKNNTKVEGKTAKHNNPDLQKYNELSETEKDSAAQSSSESAAGSEPGKEFGSAFHFSNRFTSEILKNRNGLNHNGFNQTKADNSNIYEISFEKTKAEGEYYSEKIMPQDFDTSDYETLSSGIFANKTSDSFKEHKPVENTNANVEENNLKINKEAESNTGSGEQAANTGNKGGNENPSKSAYKPSNEITFSDHMQHKTAGLTENAAPKTVKGYTSVFKEIDAAHLVDEIKNFCVRGEKSSITLKLSPEHLGTVKLSIDIKDSVMNTSIEVENESVRQVVQNNIDTLKQSLQQNGIQLSSFSVSLSNQHEQKSSGKSGSKKEKQQDNEGIKLKTEEKTVKTKKLGYNTYEYLA